MTRRRYFGLPVDALTMDETVAAIEASIDSGVSCQHVVLNAAKVVDAQRDEVLREVIEGCDIINADGMSLVWASRLLGDPLPERVTGIDLMARLLKLADDRGFRVYFLGATDEVLGSFLEVIRARHPTLEIAGAEHGYWAEGEEAEVVARISESRADMLFVAMPSPRKELFVQRTRADLGVRFVMGVGGSIDVIAGHTRRAPTWVQRTGLEWAYRLIQEPRRMFRRYLVGNTRFIALTTREAVRARRTRRTSPLTVPGGTRSGSTVRVAFHPYDPHANVLGGTATCIETMVNYATGTELRIVGVDSTGSHGRVGEWREIEVAGRSVMFLPLVALDVTDRGRRIPHSVRYAGALLRRRPRLPAGAVVQTHRVDVGWVASLIYRRSPRAQLVHMNGVSSIGSSSDSDWRRAQWVYRVLERRAVRAASDVVVFSEEGAARLQQMSPVVRFSPTWFDPEIHRPGNRPREHKAIWVGRVEATKDPLLALDVLGLAPEWSLTMVGAGTMLDRVRAEVARRNLGSRVRLSGPLQRAEVAEELRRHDVLLVTSHAEGFSRAVVEALACGLPVATTGEADPSELITDDVNGVRCHGRLPADLASALDRCHDLDGAAATASVAHLEAPEVVAAVLGQDRSTGLAVTAGEELAG